MNKQFRFKQFTIDNAPPAANFAKQSLNNDENQKCGMPVSTDGVLLGAWSAHIYRQFRTASPSSLLLPSSLPVQLSEAEAPRKILDIGTGTGLLSLMMAQSFSEAKITAIDIDDRAIQTAQHNIERSPWADRIELIQQDIKKWENTEKVDLIVCNPPYFATGLQAQSKQRATARHTNELSHRTLLDCIAEHLAPNGLACLILPTEQAEQCLKSAPDVQLYPYQITQVKTVPHKATSRILFSLSKQAAPHSTQQSVPQCKHDEIIIKADDRYTPEFTALTKSFYLNMR